MWTMRTKDQIPHSQNGRVPFQNCICAKIKDTANCSPYAGAAAGLEGGAWSPAAWTPSCPALPPRFQDAQRSALLLAAAEISEGRGELAGGAPPAPRRPVRARWACYLFCGLLVRVGFSTTLSHHGPTATRSEVG
jgi:hypothetical protein